MNLYPTEGEAIPLTTDSASPVRLIATQGVSIPNYKGEYTFTPSSATQIININGKKATQDITINPIPSNYGLITWNGSVMTIS